MRGNFNVLAIAADRNCPVLICAEKNDAIFPITFQNCRMRVKKCIIFTGADNGILRGYGLNETIRTGTGRPVVGYKNQVASDISSGLQKKRFHTGRYVAGNQETVCPIAYFHYQGGIVDVLIGNRPFIGGRCVRGPKKINGGAGKISARGLRRKEGHLDVVV